MDLGRSGPRVACAADRRHHEPARARAQLLLKQDVQVSFTFGG
jgi:hypothetical protein